MEFDKRSVSRIIKSVHTTERPLVEPFQGSIKSTAFRYQTLSQVTPVLGYEHQSVRADIFSMDMKTLEATDVDVWFLDGTLFGEPAGFIGVCIVNGGEYWHVDRLRGIPFYNSSGMNIPPYGAVQLIPSGDPTGATVAVKQPDSDGVRHPGLILINSGDTIPPLEYGMANVTPLVVSKINTSEGSIAIGDDIGPKSGSFDLFARSKGFTMRASAGAGLALVEANDNVLEIVKITDPEPDLLGLYTGVVQRFNPISMTWTDLFACKILDANQ